MLPQCHVSWRVWLLSWHSWCKMLNLRPLPSFSLFIYKNLLEGFLCAPGRDSDSSQSPQKLFSKHLQHCMLKPGEGRVGKRHRNCALVWATLNIIPVHELYNICIGTDTSYLIYGKGEWESGFPRLCPIAGNEAQGSSPSKAVLIYKGSGGGGFPFFFFNNDA